MAILRRNTLVTGMSGSIGNLILKQLRGKTILTNKPDRIKKQSALQRENRFKFKCAASYAKAMMLDENKKAYYWRMAKKLKLPNAYTAAIADYMRKGEILSTDVSQYKGKAGNTIRIKVAKKDFAVHKVEVSIKCADGSYLESGIATRKNHQDFVYNAQVNATDKIPVAIVVRLVDHIWNSVVRVADVT